MILIGYWRPKKALCKSYNPSTMIKNGKVIDDDFWRDSEDDKYPWPEDIITPNFWKDPQEKEKIVSYLKSGSPCNHYRGSSWCRICKECLGSFERTDGIYIWPDKFEHYVECHDISLPDKFIEHIRTNNYQISVAVEDMDGLEQDDSFWVECQGK